MSYDKRRFSAGWRLLFHSIILMVATACFTVYVLNIIHKPSTSGEAQDETIIGNIQEVASVNMAVTEEINTIENYYTEPVIDFKSLAKIKELEVETEIEDLQNDSNSESVEPTMEDIPEHDYYYVIDELGKEHYLPKEIQDYAWEKLDEYGLTDYFPLFIALIWHESHFKSDAVSRTDDYGYCQINSGNFVRLKKVLGLTDIPNDPYQNIDAGVYILYKAFESNNYDVEPALVCYNAGRAYTDSNDYSQGVLKDLNNRLVLLIEE